MSSDEMFSAAQVVVDKDVRALGRRVEQICRGKFSVGFFHASEVAVGAENGSGVFEIKRCDEFCPGDSVE